MIGKIEHRHGAVKPNSRVLRGIISTIITALAIVECGCGRPRTQDVTPAAPSVSSMNNNSPEIQASIRDQQQRSAQLAQQEAAAKAQH